MPTAAGQIRQKLGPLKRRLRDRIAECRDQLAKDTAVDPELHLEAVGNCRRKLEGLTHALEELTGQLSDALVETDQELEDGESDEAIELEYDAKDLIAELVGRESRLQQALTHQHERERQSSVASPSNNGSNNGAQTQSTNGSAIVARLPKLDLVKFDGDVLRWREFWDSFEASVVKHPNLSPVDKLNYLRAQLEGTARDVLAGLGLTNANFEIAVDLLKQRFGNSSLVRDTHYTRILSTTPATMKTQHLRSTYDTLERHLRSLAALGDDTEQPMLLNIVRSKLPGPLLEELEKQKPKGTEWSLTQLRKLWNDYLLAREAAEQFGAKNGLSGRPTCSQRETYHSTTETLMATNGHSRENGRRQPEASFRTRQAGAAAGSRPERKCHFCQHPHWSDECRTYSTLAARREQAKNLCYCCLKPNHRTRECRATRACVYCKAVKHHHRSLCPKQFSAPSGGAEVVAAATEEGGVEQLDTVEEAAMLAAGESVLMQTASVKIQNSDGAISQSARLILDTGSQRTYISSKLVQKLGLRSEGGENLSVYTFGAQKARTISTKYVTCKLRLKNGEFASLKANVVPNITGPLQRSPANLCKLRSALKNYSLADPLPKQGEGVKEPIDLLIGNDYYADLIQGGKVQLGPGLYLIESKFGWLLSGRVNSKNETGPALSLLTLTDSTLASEFAPLKGLDQCLRDRPREEEFWELETIGIKESPQDNDDDLALDRFNSTVKKGDQLYEVTLPWKEDHPPLPENRQLAFGCLQSLIKRLQNKPTLLQKYDAVIQEQAQNGIVEKVEKETVGQCSKHYIPHHAVITPNKDTTKLRVVYNGSAKVKKGSPSLNECLLRGPVLLEDLVGLLLRFRTNRIGIVADIEKAFLNVALQEKDRDVTRFLWLKDINKPVTQNNVQVFRFTRVPFGIISSPFLLAATLLYHLNVTKGATAETIKQNIYVDNVVVGAHNEAEAAKFYTEAKLIFQNAGMNLREWASNSQKFNQSLPKQDQVKGGHLKVLGIDWDRTKDVLALKKPNTTNDAYSKRELLQQLASIFDPLGLVAPVVLQGKLVLQELWRQGKGWDDQLDEAHVTTIRAIKVDLDQLSQLSVPRVIGSGTYSAYCFCDASEKAYAAVVYLQAADKPPYLVFAKARLAPIKQITMPRLELLAALIGSRAIAFIEKQLSGRVKDKHLWTDSQCVLHWIQSAKQLPTFVRNRVTQIKKERGVTFHYVNTEHNPADLGSRGATYTELQQSKLWWHGPPWLKEPASKWPHWDVPAVTPQLLMDIEEKDDSAKSLFEVSALAREGAECDSKPLGINNKKYSSWNKLLRVTAWCLRFINACRKSPPTDTTLMAQEIEQAKRLWLKAAQTEIDVKNSNLTQQLGLRIHNDGLWHCHGRLGNAQLTSDAITPILLPKTSRVTELIVSSTHCDIMHVGATHTLARIRLKYWIPKGRTVVTTVLRSCLQCKRQMGGPYKMPPFPPWPKEKVTPSRPFTYVGLDYLGPLYRKNETKTTAKTWVCLFTCIATRALHLEVVLDLTADQFLLALRRFVARRGVPTQITLDNAPQFKLVKNVTDRAWRESLRDERVAEFAARRGISWRFIVQHAPWMGGFYERLVGEVKMALKKCLGHNCLTTAQLQTIITEVEGMLNSRPLVFVGADLDAGRALTPGDFLQIGGASHSLPCGETEADGEWLPSKGQRPADQLLQRWKTGNNILEGLWRQWSNHYLLSLREQYKTKLKSARKQESAPAQVGDVVLIREALPRGMWKLGKIKEIRQNSMGEARSAIVETANRREIHRPLNHLFPLECGRTKPGSEQIDQEQGQNYAQNKNNSDRHTTSQDNTETHGQGHKQLPKRAAAERARAKIAEWIK